MTDQSEIHKNKLTGKTYISKRIGLEADRKIRIASKVMDGEALRYAVEKDELLLRQTPTRRKEIIAKFLEDDRGLTVVTLQSFNGITGSPHNTYFSFIGKEIPNLLKFFADIAAVQFPDEGKINMTDAALQSLIVSKEQATSLVHDNQDVFSEVVRLALTKADVVALGYRKKQVAVFDKLLNDRSYFDEVKTARKSRGDESLWQSFFEKNEWIFGYGLSYLYVSSFENKQLEQVVQGHDILHRGKRADAVMRTRGIASAICFVEIKTHETALLDGASYRAGCWAPSKELSGAVAQVQGRNVSMGLRHLC